MSDFGQTVCEAVTDLSPSTFQNQATKIKILVADFQLTSCCESKSACIAGGSSSKSQRLQYMYVNIVLCACVVPWKQSLITPLCGKLAASGSPPIRHDCEKNGSTQHFKEKVEQARGEKSIESRSHSQNTFGTTNHMM